MRGSASPRVSKSVSKEKWKREKIREGKSASEMFMNPNVLFFFHLIANVVCVLTYIPRDIAA